MTTPRQLPENVLPPRLRVQFWAWQSLVITVWVLLLIWIGNETSVWLKVGWGLVSAVTLGWQAWRLYRNLPENRLEIESPIKTTLGIANWLSLLRGSLLAYLAGFILIPAPTGGLEWLPAALYLTAALLDYLDGAAARLMHSTTRLGEVLDMELDGFGILVASIIVISNGQAPVLFIMVGAARYLFVWCIKRHEKK